MPIYEYECRKCKAHTEAFQKVTDKRLDKTISAPAIQFKGSGWYVTDYAGKATKGEKSESDAKTEKSEKTDTKAKTESSPATKPEKSSAPKTSGGD
jgi:putative FmdB family regulatory protein